MSSKEYEFNIDDILSEFYAEQSAQEAPPPEPAPSFSAPERPAPMPEAAAEPAPVRRGTPARQEKRPAGRSAGGEKRPREAQPERRERPAAREALLQVPELPEQAPAAWPQEPERREEPYAGHGRSGQPEVYPPVPEDDEEDAPEHSRAMAFFIGLGRAVLSLIFGLLALLVLGWMLLNVHPDAGARSAAPGISGSRMDLMAELNNFSNNAASDALSDLTYIPKIYTIPENATSAPVPDPSCFHTTDNPQEVMDVIAAAGGLLDGQQVAFDPNAQFQEGKPIHYYYDETILAIVWKEIIQDKCCTCAEIKVADGSQIRRKLADDTYGSAIQLYATAMSEQANAVVTLSGDFYAFRNLGITVYQREVYRCNPAQVDSCFVTASGDLLFSYAGELMQKEEAQAFVDSNDVVFAVAFGPVLVDNGELRDVGSLVSYPIGEINRTYSRTGIGLLGERHYFCMTINYDDGYRVAATLPQLAQFMYDKGCVKAYNLDGGQTSVIAVQGEAINHIDVINGQSERVVSDIIYFASALPEEADQ